MIPWRAVFAALINAALVLSLCGCDFDPTLHVYSQTRPQSQVQDGVLWIPMRVAGDDDEWFWIPSDAAVATGQLSPSEGYSYSLLVNGKVWKITCHANGTHDYEGFLQPDLAANPIVLGFAVFFGLLLIIMAPVALGGWFQAQQRQTSINAAESEIATLKKHVQEQENRIKALKENFASRDRQATKDLQAEYRRVKAEQDSIAVERNELEKQKRALVVAAKDRQVVTRKVPSDAERREFGKVVRDRFLGGKESNQEISVEYTFDPEMTGTLVFQWQLVQLRPYPLSVTIIRDRSVIRTASGVFNGEFGYWLKASGKRYRFIFELYDGSRKLPNPLVMELTLPPLDAWNRRAIPEAPPVPTKEELRRMSDEWEAREKERARQYEKDPEKLKAVFARIEQDRVEKFGEAV